VRGRVLDPGVRSCWQRQRDVSCNAVQTGLIVSLDRWALLESCRLARRCARSGLDGLIGLGQKLGMVVTAEGVETREQEAFLRSCGCDEAQGWLFSPARPVADFIDWVAQREPVDRALAGAPETSLQSLASASAAPE